VKNGVEAVATTKKSAQGHADKSNGHAKRAKKFMSSAQKAAKEAKKAAKEAKKALKKAQALGAPSSTPVTFLADNILVRQYALCLSNISLNTKFCLSLRLCFRLKLAHKCTEIAHRFLSRI
jgi:hypothetical protein